LRQLLAYSIASNGALTAHYTLAAGLEPDQLSGLGLCHFADRDLALAFCARSMAYMPAVGPEFFDD
jgi:hypothetical protein